MFRLRFSTGTLFKAPKKHTKHNNQIGKMHIITTEITSSECDTIKPSCGAGDFECSQFGFRIKYSAHQIVRSSGFSFWSRNSHDAFFAFSLYFESSRTFSKA